jgi:hypothetical protein
MNAVGEVVSFRSRRWLAPTVALALAAGCGSRPLGGVDPKPDASPDPGPGPRATRYLASNRNVDILFLVDDSSAMGLPQANLVRNFPALMTALENLPGGLPNIHIGVISSDMGAGDGSIAGCDPSGGKNGVFQYTPRGRCTTSGLAPGATYIADVDGSRNYTGSLEDTFSCIAALGETGCGFERPFAAITRALGADGQPPPPENQGFLRPDAYLAIVLITNEDDCSAKPGVPLYDTFANLDLASQLGPPANFRCNEFGHLCDGAAPRRSAPDNDVDATVTYGNCVSNESGGYLLGVQDTANRLKALKADDGQVMFAAITGAPTPYTVRWQPSRAPDRSCGEDFCPWPVITHACVSPEYAFADPAVRVAELAGKFGANGLVTSICEDDFSPALSNVASEIIAYVNEPCIMGHVAKRAGTTHDDCTVTDNATGNAIPACGDTGGAGPCWRLEAGASGCSGVSVRVTPAGGGALPLDTTVDCTMCASGVSEPARGCS